MPAEPFPIEITPDGSYTFFSPEFGETFHSRQGARTEAIEKFAWATDLPQRANGEQVVLLDVCYGLGYNTAAALEVIWQVNPHCRVIVMALELDPAVPTAALAPPLLQGWHPRVIPVLESLATTGSFESAQCEAHLILGDARATLPPLRNTLQSRGTLADAIFLDPFSPRRCPQLWTLEFLGWVARTLAPEGKLATYCRAAAVRRALQEVGLTLGTLPITEPAPAFEWAKGTLAAHPNSHAAHTLTPLSPSEQEHLHTRAAIPYRDPQLQDSAAIIVARRAQEQNQSTQESTSQWRKRWGMDG